MSEEELQAIVRLYGNDENDIKYLEFLADSDPWANLSGLDKSK